MTKLLSLVIVVAFLLAVPAPALAKPEASTVPTISIVSVDPNTSVTFKTYNFPKNTPFKVLMNYMGTKGKNGYQAGTFNSGSGGSFKLTFPIPSQLDGQKQIAIRVQATNGSGWFAYNWFFNSASGTNTGGGSSSGYSGYPTFSIQAVVRNQTVTIKAYNLPSDDTFKVLMGPMGTKGVNGYQVATINTGSGGTENYTFNIPSQLKGSRQISIRLQSTSGSGYFAYNWFYNTTAN